MFIAIAWKSSKQYIKQNIFVVYTEERILRNECEEITFFNEVSL